MPLLFGGSSTPTTQMTHGRRGCHTHGRLPYTARYPGRRQEPLLLAAVLFVAYATLSISRYSHLATRSWDLAIFEQAVRSYAHLKAPITDLKGPHTNVLGDHFSPVIAALAPAYRLFPSPITLLAIQAALFALSAVPVTRASTRLLGRGPGLLIGVAYGLSWGIQRAVDFDFHEVCFAVPLIAFSLEALLARRWQPALLWALPLLIVKEDLGLTAAAIALIVVLRARSSSPGTIPYAVGVAVFSVTATMGTLLVVIPAFNNGGMYSYWDKVSGFTPFGGIDTKLSTLLWLVLPTSGLLSLASPLSAIALPTIGWRFLSSDDHYWGTDWHYSAVLMPIVTFALIDALARARHSPRPPLRSYARGLPPAIAAAALALTITLPLSALAEPATYRTTSNVTAVDRLLARIPDEATVEADAVPAARLVSRCRVFWPGDTGNITPDYLAFDNRTRWIDDVQRYTQQLHPRASYHAIGTVDGFFVLQRVRTRFPPTPTTTRSGPLRPVVDVPVTATR